MKIAVIHGPNLNLLGAREPEVYGTRELVMINQDIKRKAESLRIEVEIFQSNHVGEILDFIQEGYNNLDGIIINPAALTYYSIELRDVLTAVQLPVIEVQISNIFRRNDLRKESVLFPVEVGQICGLGPEGYLYALEAMVNLLKRGSF